MKDNIYDRMVCIFKGMISMAYPLVYRIVNKILDHGPHVSRPPRRVWRLPWPRRWPGRGRKRRCCRSWSACNRSRGGKWWCWGVGDGFFGQFGMFFFSVGMILRLGDGSFDRFWTIVRELETDILNCFLDGLQDFLMDFRELGPTQHVNQHRSFWWILFQIETSSFQTFRCLNWNGIIWAGPPLFHTSPDTSGVSVLGAKRVWPELCVNRRSGCTWRRAWRFGSRRKRNMLVRRPKRTFWVLGFGCG